MLLCALQAVLSEQRQLRFPDHVHAGLSGLGHSCMALAQEERPSMEDVVQQLQTLQEQLMGAQPHATEPMVLEANSFLQSL